MAPSSDNQQLKLTTDAERQRQFRIRRALQDNGFRVLRGYLVVKEDVLAAWVRKGLIELRATEDDDLLMDTISKLINRIE